MSIVAITTDINDNRAGRLRLGVIDPSRRELRDSEIPQAFRLSDFDDPQLWKTVEPLDPAPRYDAAFFEGMRVLDGEGKTISLDGAKVRIAPDVLQALLDRVEQL